MPQTRRPFASLVFPSVGLRAACSLAAALLLSTAASAAAAPPAPAPAATTSVAIAGEGLTAITLSANDLAALPRLTVEAEDHGKKARFEGVALSTLLTRAGAPLGEKLAHGAKLTLVVAVDAADGYRAVFALSELDPAFTDKTVILADRRDGQPLSSTEGPFRVIAAGEKRMRRWVRQVTSLTLISVGEGKRAPTMKMGHP